MKSYINDPDITVIVPIYNVEKYVGKCLKSLLQQTYSNFEIWAISDGSPDNSLEIVDQFAKKDARIKSIAKENGGYGSVLEYAIKRISTPYFLICDPDDWLDVTALEKLHDYAIANNTDIVMGNLFNVYIEDGSKEYKEIISPSLGLKPLVNYSDKKSIHLFSFAFVSPHAKLYKTSLAKSIEFPHNVAHTDFLLYILSLANADSVAYYDEGLAYYLVNRPGNTVTNKHLSSMKSYLTVWESVFEQLPKKYFILRYRLYKYLKYAIYNYSKMVSLPFKDKYYLEICKDIKKMQFERKQLNKIAKYDSKKEYIFFRGIMSPIWNNIFLRMYIKRGRNNN